MPEELEKERIGVYLERVRHRAYALWQRDGEPEGSDQNYWFRAEREMAEEQDRERETVEEESAAAAPAPRVPLTPSD